MKKKNVLFTIITLLFLTICSIGTVNIYKNHAPRTSDVQVNDENYQLIFANLVDRYAKTLLYEVTNVESNDEKPLVNFVDPEIVNNFEIFYNMLMSDPNIKMQMIMDDKIVRSNLDDFNADEWAWYAQVSYDEKGICTSKASNSIDYCSYITFYYYYPINREDGVYEAEPREENPKNLSFNFALPKELKPSGSFYEEMNRYNEGFDWHQINAFFFIVSGIAALIMFIYMMFAPYRLVSEIYPYKIIKNYKLLIHIVIFGIAVPLFIAGGIELVRAIFQYDSIPDTIIKEEWLLAGTAVYFMLLYSFMLCAFFMIKFILKTGIVKYLKNYTYTGSIIRSIRTLFHEYATFDLNDDLNKKIFKFVVLNMVVLFFITLIPGINLIFLVIYSGCFYHFIRKKLTALQSDYEKLLRKTQRVAQGDFAKNESSNYGYFQSLGDEFENIQEGFENAVNEEVKSSKVKTELISNVSHDLKTPLTSIITYVDLLKKEDLTDEERNNYLVILDRNSLRLKHLIDDLFEVSKVNSGDVKLNLVEVDLVSLMNQTIFENEDQLANKHLEVRFTKNKEKMMMICDSLKTYRIFENLLNNIAKYALANTRVYLSLEEKEDEIIASFKNISENEMNFDTQEITDRFVRGDKSRNSEGSGLGLAIVKSFAEIQNAKFEIETDGDLFKAKVIFKKDCK